jgi:hypothetical protein
MESKEKIIEWLLESDPAIQFQVRRDLLCRQGAGSRPDLQASRKPTSLPELQARIETEGWGAAFLGERRPGGHWGRAFYQPKWTSTHYTLLDLKLLCISPGCAPARESVQLVLDRHKGQDGGINPAKTIPNSDVCVSGMALHYAAYFRAEEEDLKSIVDFLLREQMPDGGFNCESNQSGAVHSSLHSTLSVIEGINEYNQNGYSYRLEELCRAERESREFILTHRLFKSDKTGEIIDRKMLSFPFPPRWKYDILRALDYFRYAGAGYDGRMDDAIEVLKKKRKKDGRWSLQAKHPGAVHFDMEPAGKPSRWNTLRALRVFEYFNIPD